MTRRLFVVLTPVWYLSLQTLLALKPYLGVLMCTYKVILGPRMYSLVHEPDDAFLYINALKYFTALPAVLES